MSRLIVKRTLYLIVLSSMLVVAVGGVGASGDFGLEMDEEIETPETTVDEDLIGEHTLTSIGVTEADGSITVDVTAPDTDPSSQLELRSGTDADQLIDFRNIDGGADQESFSLNHDGPGTYLLLLNFDPADEILPVVVNGYDIDAAYAEDTTEDELTIEATVTPTESEGSPNEVEVVVWNDDTEERQTLAHQSGDEYETTLSLSAFDDDYQVYVSALGEDTLDTTDENEILGISTASEGLDDTNGDDNGDDDGNGNGFNDGDDDTGSDNDDSTESGDDDTENGDDQDEDTDLGDLDDETDSDDIEQNNTDSDVDVDDDSSVIEPENTTASNDDTTDATGSNNGETNDESPLSPVVVVVGILAFGIGVSRLD